MENKLTDGDYRAKLTERAHRRPVFNKLAEVGNFTVFSRPPTTNPREQTLHKWKEFIEEKRIALISDASEAEKMRIRAAIRFWEFKVEQLEGSK